MFSMKMKWNAPVITILGIDKTEAGDAPSGESDDNIIWKGHTYWSYPDPS